MYSDSFKRLIEFRFDILYAVCRQEQSEERYLTVVEYAEALFNYE
jgi:hypothetical protein